MKVLKVTANDRRAAQRGSVLSALLIIVAFLSILVGALMTELTDSFLLSQNLVGRVQREATDTSAVELGLHQLQDSAVPPVCAQDARGPWFLNLNGNPAAVMPACVAIVPDLASSLVAGTFAVDGVHDTTGGRDQYVIGDSAGRLRSYSFGQTTAAWSVSTGARVTGTPLPMVDDDGFDSLMVPDATTGSGCGGHCVLSYHNSGAAPSFHCAMPSASLVTSSPAVEVSPGTLNFPNYVFFADSSTLYVFDGAADHACPQLASAPVLGSVAGPPLVFPGTASTKGQTTTTNDEIFLLVSTGTSTSLEHWRYTETVDKTGALTVSLTPITVLGLTAQVGGTAAGYAASSSVPTVGTTVSLAVAGTTGGIAIARIAVTSGPAYGLSAGPAAVLGGGITRAPRWCHCPGRDLIGVGSVNGTLFILNTSLATLWLYDGQADGRPAIQSTPTADANGDWYFGANDGYVYDVEIPGSGQNMFKAARFGPGGAIWSSPVAGGAADGCAGVVCVYFGSTTAGAYFTQIGTTRIMDVRACVSASPGSAACAMNPRLWARVEIGSPALVGGKGILVQGWSYYSP